MTREEAIEILESIDNDEVDEEFAEAYNKAIKALEQEPIICPCCGAKMKGGHNG